MLTYTPGYGVITLDSIYAHCFANLSIKDRLIKEFNYYFSRRNVELRFIHITTINSTRYRCARVLIDNKLNVYVCGLIWFNGTYIFNAYNACKETARIPLSDSLIQRIKTNDYDMFTMVECLRSQAATEWMLYKQIQSLEELIRRMRKRIHYLKNTIDALILTPVPTDITEIEAEDIE